MEWAAIEPDIELMVSTRRLGAPITWFKRKVIHFLRQYFRELNSQQTRFNLNVLIRLAELEDRVGAAGGSGRGARRRRRRRPQAAPWPWTPRKPRREGPSGPQRRRPVRRGHDAGVRLPRAVRAWGWDGRDVAVEIDPRVGSRIAPLRALDAAPGDVLLIHYSAYAPKLRAVLELPNRKLLLSHNITPGALVLGPRPAGRRRLRARPQAAAGVRRRGRRRRRRVALQRARDGLGDGHPDPLRSRAGSARRARRTSRRTGPPDDPLRRPPRAAQAPGRDHARVRALPPPPRARRAARARRRAGQLGLRRRDARARRGAVAGRDHDRVGPDARAARRPLPLRARVPLPVRARGLLHPAARGLPLRRAGHRAARRRRARGRRRRGAAARRRRRRERHRRAARARDDRRRAARDAARAAAARGSRPTRPSRRRASCAPRSSRSRAEPAAVCRSTRS